MTAGTSPVAGRIKQGKASLVGGIAVGVAVLVLWAAIAQELSTATVPVILAGIAVAVGIAAWIRMADL